MNSSTLIMIINEGMILNKALQYVSLSATVNRVEVKYFSGELKAICIDVSPTKKYDSYLLVHKLRLQPV